MKAIVLAGGRGTRLWPLSTGGKPKHLHHLAGEESLLAETWRRVLRVTRPAEIVTVTNETQFAAVAGESEKVSGDLREGIICEPAARNTAPAIALACSWLRSRGNLGPEDTLLVCPADHLITPREKFEQILKTAGKALAAGCLVTFGVRPRGPETGYGYIRQGDRAEGYRLAAEFTEKPGRAAARRFLDSGLYYWNSGIFAFRAEAFERELTTHEPAIARLMKLDYPAALEAFPSIKPISLDYALMEKTSRCALVPFPDSLFWSDIGSWDAVYRAGGKDENGNVTSGDTVTRDLADSLVFSTGRRVAVIGLKDVIVVETPEAVLVVRRGETQKVGETVGG